MSGLQVFLFGKFCVQCDQEHLAGLDSRRLRQLFCYLLLYKDRPHPREALASLLWDDDHVDQPSRCLRKTLWQLRATLDARTEPLSDRVLLVDPDWVQISPEADLWLDVAVFEQAFTRVQGVLGKELDPQGAQALQDAVDLYQGGLQESWYQDWYLYERERFQHMYLVILDKLMGYYEARHNYEAGIACGTLVLRCERARERTHRRLMRLHYLIGDRTAALRQYARCVSALDKELGVKPATPTATLYQQLRADQSSSLAPMLVEAHNAPETDTSPLPQVLGRLKQLQAALAQVQRQVVQDIQAVELAMNDHHPSA